MEFLKEWKNKVCVSDMLVIERNGGNVLPLAHSSRLAKPICFLQIWWPCLYVQRREALGHHEAAKWGTEALGAQPFLKLFAAISHRLLVWDGVQAGLKLTVKSREALNVWPVSNFQVLGWQACLHSPAMDPKAPCTLNKQSTNYIRNPMQVFCKEALFPSS